MCVYDEIGKDIYLVVFERRRYALSEREKKRQISVSLFSVVCNEPVEGCLWEEKVFFPFFSLFPVVERFLISLLCVRRARI